jgi:hypothetical protein
MDKFIALAIREAIRLDLPEEDLKLFLETLLAGLIKTAADSDLIEVLHETIRRLGSSLSS